MVESERRGKRSVGVSPGLFISFEGIEGAGKSTQVERLRAWLTGLGREVLVVREPGGTSFSERLRELLLHGEGIRPVPWAELCLYLAARAQLVEEVIRPALAAGKVVLADRYGDASEAYQGGGRALGRLRIRTLNRWVTNDLRPHRVILFDLDPVEGLRRVRRRRGSLDRLESEPLQFHRRVRQAYLRMARREPTRFVLCDASRAPGDLAVEIQRALLPLVSGRGSPRRRGLAPKESACQP